MGKTTCCQILGCLCTRFCAILIIVACLLGLIITFLFYQMIPKSDVHIFGKVCSFYSIDDLTTYRTTNGLYCFDEERCRTGKIDGVNYWIEFSACHPDWARGIVFTVAGLLVLVVLGVFIPVCLGCMADCFTMSRMYERMEDGRDDEEMSGNRVVPRVKSLQTQPISTIYNPSHNPSDI